MQLAQKIFSLDKSMIDKDVAKSILAQNNPWMYLLLVNKNSVNPIEFGPLWEYSKKTYKNKELKIIGFANSKSESIALTVYIVETYLKTGQLIQNIKTYLWNM